MEYKFLKIICLPYVKIFNITWALCVNYVPGFSEIGDFFHFWGVAFLYGDFFDPLSGREKNNVFRTRGGSTVVVDTATTYYYWLHHYYLFEEVVPLHCLAATIGSSAQYAGATTWYHYCCSYHALLYIMIIVAVVLLVGVIVPISHT